MTLSCAVWGLKKIETSHADRLWRWNGCATSSHVPQSFMPNFLWLAAEILLNVPCNKHSNKGVSAKLADYLCIDAICEAHLSSRNLLRSEFHHILSGGEESTVTFYLSTVVVRTSCMCLYCVNFWATITYAWLMQADVYACTSTDVRALARVIDAFNIRFDTLRQDIFDARRRSISGSCVRRAVAETCKPSKAILFFFYRS